MYVLVVEDERRLAQVIRKVLEEEGHTVDVAYDGEEGLAMAMDGSHDIIVLDILLPGIDGIEVCRLLRANRIDTPVLLLTALDAVEDRVRGLDAGADDYLPKPFAFQELLARLRALSRRRVQAREADRLETADLVLHLRRRRAERGGKRIELSPKEFALLEFLMRNEGPRCYPHPDPGPRLGIRLLAGVQPGGRVRHLSSAQGRPGSRSQADPHRTRSRLRCRRLACSTRRGGVSLSGSFLSWAPLWRLLVSRCTSRRALRCSIR